MIHEPVNSESNEPDKNPHELPRPHRDEQGQLLEILSLDYVYEALAHPRRRYLCYTLCDDIPRSLTDLATKIAAFENDSSEHAITASQRERVYVSLYHTHVPKLAADSVLTFDPEMETIGAAEHTEQVLTALEGMSASLVMAHPPRTGEMEYEKP